MCVCGGGGGCVCVCGGELFWNFNCLEGILYVFLWTETGLAFLDRSRTEIGTPTKRLQVKKKAIKSPTLFYECPFNNTAHYYVLKRYNFSCYQWRHQLILMNSREIVRKYLRDDFKYEWAERTIKH